MNPGLDPGEMHLFRGRGAMMHSRSAPCTLRNGDASQLRPRTQHIFDSLGDNLPNESNALEKIRRKVILPPPNLADTACVLTRGRSRSRPELCDVRTSAGVASKWRALSSPSKPVATGAWPSSKTCRPVSGCEAKRASRHCASGDYETGGSRVVRLWNPARGTGGGTWSQGPWWETAW